MKFIRYIAVLLLCFSCVKEVDFDQFDEVEIRSVYIASLAFFQLVADDFLDDNFNEIQQLEDFVIPQLNTDSVDNLEKMEFAFEFSNSFPRDFFATVYFFDIDGNVIYKLEPDITILRNTKSIQTVITVEQPYISLIYSAYRAGFVMQMQSDDSEPFTYDTDGELSLKSSLTLYLNATL